MDKPRIPPVISQSHKLLKAAEDTMRKQCALLNAAAAKDVIDADQMIGHLDLFIRLICLDLASVDSRIAEEEARLLNALFQQNWPAEQYAALQYDIRNEHPDIISKEMGARLLACNIMAAQLTGEPYDPDTDWLLKTVAAIGKIVIGIDRQTTPGEKARMDDILRKIHDEAHSLLASLSPR